MRSVLICLSLIVATAIAQPASWWTTSILRSAIPSSVPSGQSQLVGGVSQTYLPASTMLSANAFPGNPCRATNDCQAPNNAKLLRYIETRPVEPIGRVTGLSPALDSLETVFNNVRTGNSTLYGYLGTAGMLCCRLIRGSSTSFSNHAWGAAIDVKINGVIDTFADDRIINGMIVLAPYFQAQGWYWGVGFSREDGMHFEVSQQRMTQWINSGVFGGSYTTSPPRYPLCASANYFPTLQTGSTNTAAVKMLQALLNYHGTSAVISVDGAFGAGTNAAVKTFQTSRGLTSDGIVGAATWSRLWPSTLIARQGDSGWHIYAVLERLRGIGYSLLNGLNAGSTSYSSAMFSAIKDFQADRYFLEDGSITQAVLEAMISNPPCVNAAAYSGVEVTDTAGLIVTDTDSAASFGFSAVFILVLALLAMMI